MAKSTLFLVILVPVVAIVIQRYLFSGLDTPPSDFGSGSMFDSIARRECSVSGVRL